MGIMKRIAYLSVLLVLLLTNISWAQWQLRNNGINESINNLARSIDALDGNFAVAAFYTKIYKTNDSGLNWVDITPPNESNFVDVSVIDTAKIWTTTGTGKIMYTNNGGNSWAVQFYDISKTQFMNYIRMFDSLNGIAMGDAANSNSPAMFLKTTNKGVNWISVNNNLKGDHSNNAWGNVDFIDMNNGYFSSGNTGENPNQILKTSDGGLTWTTTNKFVMDVVKFYDINVGVLANLASVYRTTDGLNSMDSVRSFFGFVTDIEFLPGDKSKVFYLEIDNLFFSSDTGKTWQILLSSAPEGSITELKGRDMVFTDNNHCWIICNSGRVFYNSNISGTITGIEQETNVLPENYVLEQNYPNPFNPSTVIKFQLPESGFVTLKIYDMLGREIKTLVNEYKTSGSYSVRFNATGLASGVYLYELQVNNYYAVKKLMLLR